eukprot:g36323.t1
MPRRDLHARTRPSCWAVGRHGSCFRSTDETSVPGVDLHTRLLEYPEATEEDIHDRTRPPRQDKDASAGRDRSSWIRLLHRETTTVGDHPA